MNSLKTMLMMVMLAVIAGAVYVTVNNNPESEPPAELAEGWPSNSPTVEVPQAEDSPFAWSSAQGADSASGGVGSPGEMAPPFVPDPSLSDGQEVRVASSVTPLDAPRGTPHGISPPPSGMSPPPNAAMPSNLPGAGGQPQEVSNAFANFLDAAHRELEEGKLAEVHRTLSLWYDKPQLTPEENRRVTELLDQLAGEVIFSQEHLIEQPHIVQAGDTLAKIADVCKVPWQLLAKINRISDPENLAPGRELKLVRGPFEAVVHLERRELTLLLGGLYAGRFPIGLGLGQQDLAGSYLVQEKLTSNVEANPLGMYFIKLNDQIAIHGSQTPDDIGTDHASGSISLGPKDLEDVHDILSIGSRIQILR